MMVAYDIKLMKPACVLVAAGLGGDPAAAREFPTRLWLLAPTPDMRVYETTPEQLQMLVVKTKLHHGIDPLGQIG